MNKLRSICFVTTGDLKNNATAKRALGMASPLSDLGWKVYVIMEDTAENRHRASMECDGRTVLFYYPHVSASDERNVKSELLQTIRPDYVYLCAFVFRNIVTCKFKCVKIVEHSELLSSVRHRNKIRKALDFLLECFSPIYADGLVCASSYLKGKFESRMKWLFMGRRTQMLYLPYAYNPDIMRVKTVNEDWMSKYAGKVIFVYLGTVSYNYGIYTIIEAVRELRKDFEGFCVIVLGHGKDYDNAVNIVGKYGLSDYVIMRGFVNEESIPFYFSLASAFISPMNDTMQDWARCPSKLYMYLPYKKPIITCRIGEPFSVLGEHGTYYLPGDAYSLRERMADVIEKKVVGSQINPSEHTWEARAESFCKWVGQNFMHK